MFNVTILVFWALGLRFKVRVQDKVRVRLRGRVTVTVRVFCISSHYKKKLYLRQTFRDNLRMSDLKAYK